MVSCRSTKSASKARRDHINAEIRNMRALLPISAEDQERLSYLHTMAIICTFIRKTALLTADGEKSDEGLVPPHEDLLQALPGFIVVMTSQGKLVCVSENVSQYLGFSMVEILQSDTFYDLIHADDVDSVKLTLEGDLSAAGRSFVCHMNTSKAFRLQYGSCCPLLVRGHYQDPQHSLFVALCAPTMDRLMDTERLSFRTHFQSVHRADMSYTYTERSVVLYLGYEAEELIGRSWYSMLHPDDLSLTASAHTHLMRQRGAGEGDDDGDDEGEEMVELVFRVQTKTLLWIWIFSRASKFTHKQEITCTNFLISEAEALYLRQKLYSAVSAPPLTPPISQMPWGPGPCRSPKRPAEGSDQSARPRRKVSRLSERAGSTSRDHRDRSADRSLFSTPPYSPASSVSDDSLDTLQDVMSPSFSSSLPSSSSSLSSSSSSLPFQHLQPLPVLRNSFSVEPCPLPPPTLSYPEGPAEASLVPDYQPEGCESSPDCVLHYRNFSLLPELMADEVGTFQAPEDSGSSSLVELLTSGPSLTVHESTLSNLSYTEREQAEISVLAHQISSLASSFDLYRAKSHNSNFTCAPCWPSAITLPTELLLDEDVIDSILRDCDGAPVKRDSGSGWRQIPRISPDEAPGLQNLSLDIVVNSVPLEPQLADGYLWPSVYRQDCHEENIESHQLSLYLHGNFQQDGFADESMY
ncbi:neuronal PAS domain-containing protein 4-like [Pygocentrus nattereri]|uniref:neuronal PAS domain-containing protein 4-like n=1 Tax=Pygocentrus nattereri TaxID=42514 RepID=UPI000814A866|nr:neuronal PAS domain-containing protein 4-like [Pygocentrus nattereri]